MTVDEARNAIQELKAQGLTDEGIAASLYEMYKNDKIDVDQFEALVKLVGYDLSEEFRAMSDEEKKSQDMGSFGMDDEEDGNENPSDDAPAEEEASEEPEKDEEKEEEDENPFEKKDENSSFDNDNDDDEEKKEAKKMYGF